MTREEFRSHAHEMVDWIADYFGTIEDYPVLSDLAPKSVIKSLPQAPPEEGEPFELIKRDFFEKILPGMTHWQHPKFFAYFPANNSYPSLLGEMLTAALGAQCMVWQTSPAAAELEEVTMNWLAEMIGLPKTFSGVIQDTASTATLVSLLTAREKFSEFSINNSGFSTGEKYRIYCSTEAHSSIEKAVKIAGFGRDSLVRVPVGQDFAMKSEKLEEQIREDLAAGFNPVCIVAALGTTGSTAVDPLEEIGLIAEKYNIWLHVDAAFAGTALILPEYGHLIKGIEYADTFVFNPHKWMFTNFDCSAYFVRDKGALIRTFEIMPEYLKTPPDKVVNNYRDWGIQLGRRFRALKLWFVIRSYGIKGLQEKLRYHINLTRMLLNQMNDKPQIEILAPVLFNTICFRFNPGIDDEETINKINEELLAAINKSGKAYLSHTKLNGKYAIRIVIGQTNVNERHVTELWDQILEETGRLKVKYSG